MHFWDEDFDQTMFKYFSGEQVEEDPERISGVFADEPDQLHDEALSVARYRASRGLLP